MLLALKSTVATAVDDTCFFNSFILFLGTDDLSIVSVLHTS